MKKKNHILQVLFEGNLPEKFQIDVHHRILQYTLPHWHDFYEIEICLSGSAVMNVNGTEYEFKENTLLFITPSDFHSIKVLSDSISVINFTFDISCIEPSNFGNILSSMKYIVSSPGEETTEKFIYFINMIEKELNGTCKFNRQYVTHLLICILIELFRIPQATGSAEDESVTNSSHVQNMIYYIRKHFKERLTLEDSAEYANISPAYASKIFKDITGYGFKQYLTELRLLYAENLLTNSDESVSDISYFCGFTTTSHFANTFKKKYKTAPTSFRKLHNSKQNNYTDMNE